MSNGLVKAIGVEGCDQQARYVKPSYSLRDWVLNSPVTRNETSSPPTITPQPAAPAPAAPPLENPQ